AVMQQTPCAQEPEPHSGPLPQDAPTFFSVQLLPLQVNGATQSASTVHVFLHALAPHAYGLHIDVVAVWQVPVPLQDRADVSVEPAQVCAAHCVPEAYNRQLPAPL